MKYAIKIKNEIRRSVWNHRWRGRSKVEDSVVTIDGNVVAEFVWFKLKENAAETKLRKYPWETKRKCSRN